MDTAAFSGFHRWAGSCTRRPSGNLTQGRIKLQIAIHRENGETVLAQNIDLLFGQDGAHHSRLAVKRVPRMSFNLPRSVDAQFSAVYAIPGQLVLDSAKDMLKP
jgi:hypothetical protein